MTSTEVFEEAFWRRDFTELLLPLDTAPNKQTDELFGWSQENDAIRTPLQLCEVTAIKEKYDTVCH